ncbi:MAG: hypothetical protein OXF65_12265, partial [Acidimicrobiaceae bacterium]|nr:hypothetical protein [Acidimicrobiaceae bacterium]
PPPTTHPTPHHPPHRWIRAEKFYKHIDTVVGFWNDIPIDSDIEVPPHVSALGYDDLLERLCTPGPHVPWDDDDWDTFARQLNLYRPDADSEPELARRTQIEVVEDYRNRARAFLGEGLGRLIDIGSIDSVATKLFAADIGARVGNGRMVGLVGASGTGKSFLARHIAIQHLDEGRLVVWLRAGAYEMCRFREFLAQAMGPYSVETWRTLVQAAADTGISITIVIDGLNECPTDARSQMFERLSAFLLQFPASVLFTCTSTDHLQGVPGTEVLRLNAPDEQARLEILHAHGAKDPNRISEQFRTPYELSVAAMCEQELPAGASVTEVEAAYIHQLAPTEQIRAGLRALASRMHARLRTSLSLLDATQALSSPSLGLQPIHVDAVLDCRLLAVDQHRLRFGHELFGRFLAAEDLVHQSDSGDSLGLLLSAPGNSIFARTALSIEGDPRRVWQAVMSLSDPDLVVAATDGDFGPEVTQLATDATRRVLQIAVTATESGQACFEPLEPFFSRWAAERQWSDTELALFSSAGQGLAQGQFVGEICDVLDATDRVCLQHARRWRADGEPQPVSRTFAATYTQTGVPADSRGLAASYIVRAFELSVMGRRFTPGGPVSGLARRLASGAGQWSWGRFRLAAMCVDPRDAADQEFFASLLNAAWNAGGYHLRLEFLETARYFHDSEEPHRSDILEQINQFDTDNLFLQSAITEALASFGEIESPVTAEELRADIRETISHPRDRDRCEKARSIVSHQFEEESIVGPYLEAVEGLTERERAKLLTMAARGAGLNGSFHLDWTLNELVKIVPMGDDELDDDAKSALRIFVDEPSREFLVHPAAEDVWLRAVRGWAKLEPALPPQSGRDTTNRHNWRLLGALFFSNERNGEPVELEAVWDALLDDLAETIPNLARLEHATFEAGTYERSRQSALEHLIQHHPGPMRRLFETALGDEPAVGSDLSRDGSAQVSFAMRILGAVGTESTAMMLEPHTPDPETGTTAVEAIRQIHRRTAP